MSNASSSQAPPDAELTPIEAQVALRDSEERFRAFVTAGTDVVYRMNADWSELCQLVGRNFVVDAPQPTDDWLAEYIYPEDQTRAEQALRASEELYRGLFNSIDEGFAIIEMIFDADHRPVDYLILEVNPGFE